MDRIISLLAALVGLIALGGAILVHTNGDAQRNQMAAEIAQLKLSVGLITQQQRPVIAAAVASAEPSSSSPPPNASTTSMPSAAPSTPSAEPSASSAEPFLQLQPSSPTDAEPKPVAGTTDMAALLDRIAQLEQTTREQASQLEAARAQLASAPAASEVSSAPASAPASSAAPEAAITGGPASDCIPLGTRFMGAAGDEFPICKTKLTVKVAAVSDGVAKLAGAAGDVAAGASVPLDKTCSVMVFSADSSGYAEMRVTCP